ncbi:MAG TPA: phospho-N-acetylmuramoyl-pentapeptide-transferase [Acidimicrobiales bacterium]|nr:phospho-N-acetylmuramoyl-pentapeptide-transferase [Acidimicrobiales bacterium]
MISLLVAGATGLLVAGLGTPLLIRWLASRGIGQQIRDDGPLGHVTKAGTPTMGGLAIVVAVFAGYLVGHVRIGTVFSVSGLAVMLALGGGAAVGLADDWIKFSRHRSLGLNKRTKLAGQLAVAVAFALVALHWSGVSTQLSFTRSSSPGLALGSAGWAVLAVLLLIGSANAVNLTDGLDGLAAGSAVFAFATLAVIGYWQFRHTFIYHVPQGLDLALAAMALTGACAGFLWWNAAPARIFMGDTGSLAIGAALAGLCLEMNLVLLLPVIAGLFVMVTLSVIIQVASYRLFHRRVFRMAPLHHHFELLGWPETTVIVRFWILAGVCTALALGLFYADFLSLGLVS